MSAYQDRYWSELREIKTHVIYLQKYAIHSDWWDKAINIFLAITSSSSIAAWAIWQEYSMYWAVIIALSQVITAIKPFLPYKQRIKVLSDFNDKLQEISLNCERSWFNVAEGRISEEEIHDLYIAIKNQSLDAERKCLKNMVLPTNNKILKLAEADLYLRKTYHGENN